ncbi:hypothetical protein [Bacillus thuringiensis]|uniref:hypothetical protein n=1 Tax=Bacillus thuringiensis TaxID=1428 RepID=UPI002100643B|nr:hypothetical protein [Bacillus thuringiensis]
MVQIQRKYNFMPGTTISSGQVNEEFTNLINAYNDNDGILQNLNEYGFYKNNIRVGNFLMTYKRCAMHHRSFNPLWRQMGGPLRRKS